MLHHLYPYCRPAVPLLWALLCLLPASGISQNLKKYWVEFTDKDHSPYSIWHPADFLSARAIERRAQAGIAVVENDLPVDPTYLNALKASGVALHTTSRWLNAASVISDTTAIQAVRRLPFVKSVSYLGPHLRYRNPPNRPTKPRRPVDPDTIAIGMANLWGYAAMQDMMLGVPILHVAGYRGAGKWIAVMDGGFTNVDSIPLFDSIALQNRLFAAHDFVEHDQSLYESAQHGTSVLSIMAGNISQYYVGTAPDATYFLLKTEDTGGEFPIEEANWIAGAEWADSAGVDIINASLGYTQFNDTTLGHRYWELDGRTAIGSRGAAIAATKGMIICNSAGNEGDSPWKHVGVPADAPGIVAVGSVTFEGARSAFSSEGPTADGRIKPDLMAPGEAVVTAGAAGPDLSSSSGTSLASPMLAGALASLWSAVPEYTAHEVLDAVFAHADQATAPDIKRGYGLPNLPETWVRLKGFDTWGCATDHVGGTLTVLVQPYDMPLDGVFELRDIFGRRLPLAQPVIRRNQISTLIFSGLQHLPSGIYSLIGIGKEWVGGKQVAW